MDMMFGGRAAPKRKKTTASKKKTTAKARTVKKAPGAVRNFVVTYSSKGNTEGSYTGRTPRSAASKAATQRFNQYGGKELVIEVRQTHGERRFRYKVTRESEPTVVNGIKYGYKNVLKKVPVK